MFAEKQVKTNFWMSHQKTVSKVARQLFGEVWENLGKNLLHSQNFACSYTYVYTEHSHPACCDLLHFM